MNPYLFAMLQRVNPQMTRAGSQHSMHSIFIGLEDVSCRSTTCDGSLSSVTIRNRGEVAPAPPEPPAKVFSGPVANADNRAHVLHGSLRWTRRIV